MKLVVRRVWRYQRGNQNPYNEEEQTTQWPKEKAQKDKQRFTKHTYKTKDRVTWTPRKTGGELLTRLAIFIDSIKPCYYIFSEYWFYVKEQLTKHEQDRYFTLKHINTDAGRGRAWLRAALNEHSLERYMHMLLESDELLRYIDMCVVNQKSTNMAILFILYCTILFFPYSENFLNRTSFAQTFVFAIDRYSIYTI